MDKLLLLEDDVSLIDGLTYSLGKQGYKVDVARTVAEASALLSDLTQYTMLLLDVTLPDGTGFEICEQIRRRSKQIPIIFLTASDEEVSIIRGLDSGGDDYMTSPSGWESCAPVSAPCCAGPTCPALAGRRPLSAERSESTYWGAGSL